jgi:endonuclease/exonuclease/phosphatase family metal-dependent hydrolase
VCGTSNGSREFVHAGWPWPLLCRFANTQGGLFTLSKFPIVREKFSPFSRLNHSITEMLGNKGILESIVTTPQGEMRILNTHLHAAEGFWGSWLALGSWVRFKQFKKILDYAGEDTGIPTILAGDFNEHAIIKQEELVRLLENTGLVQPLAEQPIAATFRRENIFVDTWSNRPDISQCLDYILVRSFDRFNLVAHSYNPVYLKPELSDHDPIILVLTLKQ